MAQRERSVASQPQKGCYQSPLGTAPLHVGVTGVNPDSILDSIYEHRSRPCACRQFSALCDEHAALHCRLVRLDSFKVICARQSVRAREYGAPKSRV